MVSLAAFVDELEKLGEDEGSKPSLLRRILPAVLGTAAGVGGYKLLRRVKFSKVPAVRKMQQKAKGRLTHLDELPNNKMPGPFSRLGQRFVRGVDEVINEPRSVVKAREKLTVKELAKQQAKKVKGAIMPMGGPRQAASYKGDLHLNPNPQVGVRLEDKLHEARLLNKLPGGAPQSRPLSDLIGSRGKATTESLDALQQDLAKKFPKGYVIKPINDAASGGVPTHKDRFATILTGGKGTDHQKWMKDMMVRPERYMVQEYIPIRKTRRLLSNLPRTGSAERRMAINEMVDDEWRVHVADGKVIPGSTMHRWTFDAGMSPSARKEISEVDRFMQKNLNKMPRDARGVPMAADVVRTTDGSLKILELNTGGQSGFLLSPTLRGSGWQHYKGVTGRASQAESLVKGLGAGAATTIAASLALPDGSSKDKKKKIA
jgi:hypothetical protein